RGVAGLQLGGEPMPDSRDPVAHFAGHELEPSPGRLVIEKNAADGEDAERLAVVDSDEMPVGLRHAVGGAGIERRVFVLRRLANATKHLRRRRLIEPRSRRNVPYRLEDLRDPESRELSGENRLIPARRNEGLCGDVVDLLGLDRGEEGRDRVLIEEIALMERQ